MAANYIDLNAGILQTVQAEEYAGYDPFDFLNSTVFANIKLAQSALMRLAWLQFGKRSPVNLRSIIGVAKQRNPKGVALFILGMLEDFKRTGDSRFLCEATALAEWLLTQQSNKSDWKYPCWGYHFDWQARAFYVPKGKPNIITTCYVALAIYRLGLQIDRTDLLDIALNSARFICLHLLTKQGGKTYFAYVPGEKALVHNANLWGAAWVAKAGVELSDDELVKNSIAAARETVKEQKDDGSWVYGTRSHHQFIDGFHTGYNLEALDILRRTLGTKEFDKSIGCGMDYYRVNFFLEDGTVKYFNNNLFPLDMHSFSQGILTLLKVGDTQSDIDLAKKIMHQAVERMYLPKEHRFIYQKHRWYTNKINYIRWTQAWSYYGLAFYNRYMADISDEAN
ncbi:MAG: hypothetical protein ABW166_16360 [Sedimenticola sp.]